ncbi:hypothetical protein F511_31166 [Dorcoceras hygrometricum]|uniref:Uncharacterized protein n=1 Tax=Dorcoceras hygrometricum TaxID=472368 RepID=A0A2Z7DH09_9LAMI|nr:hypothetical protein F511_31166 [Dorcoceras hygrometricum]
MSLFDLQDVCIAIGSLATLDLPMVVDLIGIYVLKGPYCTLTTTNWFLQALSVIPRGSWRDVSRRFTMIHWATAHPLPNASLCRRPPIAVARRPPPPSLGFSRDRTCFDHRDEENPFVLKSFRSSSADLRRKIVSNRGPDCRSTTAYRLKCRFPRETGRSQAPRRLQELYPYPKTIVRDTKGKIETRGVRIFSLRRLPLGKRSDIDTCLTTTTHPSCTIDVKLDYSSASWSRSPAALRAGSVLTVWFLTT